jgi:hypothetical protein
MVGGRPLAGSSTVSTEPAVRRRRGLPGSPSGWPGAVPAQRFAERLAPVGRRAEIPRGTAGPRAAGQDHKRAPGQALTASTVLASGA